MCSYSWPEPWHASEQRKNDDFGSICTVSASSVWLRSCLPWPVQSGHTGLDASHLRYQLGTTKQLSCWQAAAALSTWNLGDSKIAPRLRRQGRDDCASCSREAECLQQDLLHRILLNASCALHLACSKARTSFTTGALHTTVCPLLFCSNPASILRRHCANGTDNAPHSPLRV
jgi:hypothetical protein